MSKEEDFVKKFKTLIRELVISLRDTTNDPGEWKRSKELIEALDDLEKPNQQGYAGYY